MSFEALYRESDKNMWSEKPDGLLVEIAPLVPRGRVLDLGMGEGRNALFFAQNGFDVRGVDLSETAVGRCIQRAQARGLPIETEVGDLLDTSIEPGGYSLIISAMTLQFLTHAQGWEIIGRIRDGLEPGGIVYLTVFSTEDPGYERMRAAADEVEHNTFYSDRFGGHIHFFERDELFAAFEGFELLHAAQSIFRDEGHPGTPDPHYHGTLTYVGRKP